MFFLNWVTHHLVISSPGHSRIFRVGRKRELYLIAAHDNLISYNPGHFSYHALHTAVITFHYEVGPGAALALSLSRFQSLIKNV